MHPTIMDGETIVAEPVDALAVKRGEIVLYRTTRGLIAHRVIAIRKKGASRLFTLRGDAARTSCEMVEAEQVMGRVIRVERGGREIDLRGKGARFRQMAGLRAAWLKNALLRARRTETI
jgi:signal peptidase I